MRLGKILIGQTRLPWPARRRRLRPATGLIQVEDRVSYICLTTGLIQVEGQASYIEETSLLERYNTDSRTIRVHH